jgi:hypothetical protein
MKGSKRKKKKQSKLSRLSELKNSRRTKLESKEKKKVSCKDNSSLSKQGQLWKQKPRLKRHSLK